MKRLLLIAHTFPPAPSPGALRPGYLARYLPEYGWDVRVVTAPVESPAALQGRLRRAMSSTMPNPNAPLRRFLRGAKELVLFPDATAPWIPSALREGRRALSEDAYDAILSTAHPPSVHVIAWALAMSSGLPWIADYRDPWAWNAYNHRSAVSKFFERRLERLMLRRADAITTKSETDAELIGKFHGGRHVETIENAYDPTDWEAIPDEAPERFDLCFTGTMYDGKRSPDPLFEALRDLRAAGDPAGLDARVHFYGKSNEYVRERAAAYGLADVVFEHGLVERRTAMLQQRRSAALLIFLSMDPATSHEVGSKYLEYAGARRPILAVGPSTSALRPVIERGRLGWFTTTASDVSAALKEAYAQFSNGVFATDPDLRVLPTARALAARFSAVLDAAADRRRATLVQRADTP